jgi:hypothetical protein
LGRQVPAYHLAAGLELDKLYVFWGNNCGVNDLFAQLFGTNYLPISNNLNITFPFNIDWLEEKKTTNSTNSTQETTQKISWIFGNYPVAMFDRPQQVPNDAYEGQVRAEASMYRVMMDRFVYKDEVLAFQRNHSFDRHTVIGLHLRHGNGETGDFADKGREMKVPEGVWLANFVSMIFNYTRTDSRFQSKPPLIFLATDGPSRLKDILESDLNHEVPVVMVPQPRVAEGEGVSYNKGGEDILGCPSKGSDPTWSKRYGRRWSILLLFPYPPSVHAV